MLRAACEESGADSLTLEWCAARPARRALCAAGLRHQSEGGRTEESGMAQRCVNKLTNITDLSRHTLQLRRALFAHHRHALELCQGAQRHLHGAREGGLVNLVRHAVPGSRLTADG